MRFFYYTSIVLLCVAALFGLMTFIEGSALIFLLYIQFGLGCLHAVSSMLALFKLGTQNTWFIWHFFICLTYLVILLNGGFGLSFNDGFATFGFFILPWLIALFHTYKLSIAFAEKRLSVLDI